MSTTENKGRLRCLWGTTDSVEGGSCGEPVCVCGQGGGGGGGAEQNVSEGGLIKILANGEDSSSHPSPGETLLSGGAPCQWIYLEHIWGMFGWTFTFSV